MLFQEDISYGAGKLSFLNQQVDQNMGFNNQTSFASVPCVIQYRGNQQECLRQNIQTETNEYCTAEFLQQGDYSAEKLDFSNVPLEKEERVKIQNEFRFRDQDIEGKSLDSMSGAHGEYDISKGYFACLTELIDVEPEKYEFEMIRPKFIAMRESDFYSQHSRAFIIAVTMYDITTEAYTNINLLIEISAAGFFSDI